MDHATLVELEAFERLHGPQDAHRTDALVGVLASVVANVNRDPKRKPQAYSPQDFVPKWDQGRLARAQSADEIAAKMTAFATAANRGR